MCASFGREERLLSREKPGSPSSASRGYTIFEMLLVVAVIGILGGIGSVVISQNLEKSRLVKLESDIRTINQAADVYLAGGGSFSGVKTAQDVVDRMKTRISESQQRRHAGVITESSVDVRLEAVNLMPQEMGKPLPRAIWNPMENRFEIAHSGKGVKEFRLNEDLDPGEAALGEQNRLSPMLYASEGDSWVWDYQEIDRPDQISPTTVTTTPLTTDLPATTEPKLKLLAPQVSLQGGSYLLGDFDLFLELINPNPSGTSTLFYQIDGGLQLEYTGPLTVPPDATVSAMAVGTTPTYLDSSVRTNTYAAKTEVLAAPTISVSIPYFGDKTDTVGQVTITHSNDLSKGGPEIYYTLNGGPPTVYAGPFSVERTAYETTALDIAAWVQSASVSYLPSPTDDELVKVELDAPLVAIKYTGSGNADMIVTLTDPNLAGLGEVWAKIVPSGDDPSAYPFVKYSGPVTAKENDYPDGFIVETYTLAMNPARFVDSLTVRDGGVFFGLPIKGQTVFVIDSSGSMDGDRMDTVKSRMLDLIDQFSGSNYMAIVEFDSSAKTMLNWNKMDASGKALAKAAVEDLEADGGTYYQLAFEQVDAILEAVVLSGQTLPEEIIFLTDGSPTTGGLDTVVRNQVISDYEAASGGTPYYPSGLDSATLKAAWIRAQNLREKYNITVSTIAIGTGTSGGAYTLLKAMAEDNNSVGTAGFVSEVSL